MVEEAYQDEGVLARALAAFEQETGLALICEKNDFLMRDQQVDALLYMPEIKKAFPAKVKRWAQNANIGLLIDQVERLPERGILVADYINPPMARKLKEAGVQFIDGEGNAYLNEPPLYIYVVGNRPKAPMSSKRGGQNRAFERMGLKVIYAFLRDPDLVRAPYREIADRADVALGTVGWAFNGLKAGGYLFDQGKRGKRRLNNYKKLLDRWVELYPEKLRHKQKVGEFLAQDSNWWKDLEIRDYNAYLGGEIAAERFTHYLKPQVGTVYIKKEDEARLFAQARFRKATGPYQVNEQGAGGRVDVYRPFWTDAGEIVDVEPGYVHPILAYADLMSTGDSRNIEVARMIYEQYIAHLGE